PTTSIGNSLAFAENAENIIVEINMQQPDLEGVHDLYSLEKQGERAPIPLTSPQDRIGTPGVVVDPEKIKGVVCTEQIDSASTMVPPDEETKMMAEHLLTVLRSEVDAGRLDTALAAWQSGIGSVASAVLHGMMDSEFQNVEVYSEVLQDAVFDLIDAGKVTSASCCSITLSDEKMEQEYRDFDDYRDNIVMRPQEISNHPEIIRRLGLISVNTALEADIYGNINSTHVT